MPEPIAPMKSATTVRAPMHMPPKAAAVGMYRLSSFASDESRWPFITILALSSSTLHSHTSHLSVPATTTSEPSDSAFYASCADVVDACAAGGTAGSSGKVRVSRVDLGEVTHTFSHVRHTYVAQHEVWEMSDDDSAPSTRGDTAGGREWRWVTATELETLGLSSGVRKIYELLTKREKAKRVAQHLNSQTNEQTL